MPNKQELSEDLIGSSEKKLLTKYFTWNGNEYPIPSLEELMDWSSDGCGLTPDGDVVEPDHPDSWLRLLGLI